MQIMCFFLNINVENTSLKKIPLDISGNYWILMELWTSHIMYDVPNTDLCYAIGWIMGLCH